jgi:hypothetical protein
LSALLHELQGAGVEVYLAGEKVKLRGSRTTLTPELLDRVKEHKAELLAALTGPPSDMPLVTEPDVLDTAQVEAVCRLMDKAGAVAFKWVLGAGGRADQYEEELAFSHRDADLTAAVDYLLHLHKPDGENRADQILKLLGAPLTPYERQAATSMNRAVKAALASLIGGSQ